MAASGLESRSLQRAFTTQDATGRVAGVKQAAGQGALWEETKEAKCAPDLPTPGRQLSAQQSWQKQRTEKQ